jgi:hypothetical protein
MARRPKTPRPISYLAGRHDLTYADLLADCRPDRDGARLFEATPFDCVAALAEWTNGGLAPCIEDLHPVALVFREMLEASVGEADKTEAILERLLERLGLRGKPGQRSELDQFSGRARDYHRAAAVLALMDRDKIGRERAFRLAAEEYSALGSEHDFRRAIEDLSKKSGGLDDIFFKHRRRQPKRSARSTGTIAG